MQNKTTSFVKHREKQKLCRDSGRFSYVCKVFQSMASRLGSNNFIYPVQVWGISIVNLQGKQKDNSINI